MEEQVLIPFGAPFPPEVQAIVDAAPKVIYADSTEKLFSLSVRDARDGWHEVAYETPGKGRVVEAHVCRTRNGIVANYPEPYMRRRDPDSLVIGDNLPTDQERFTDRYDQSFDALRQETFEWLKGQELAVFAFLAGNEPKGFPALAVCPANAGFFALALAMIQGIRPLDQMEGAYHAVIYVAPTFRHTHFGGRQIIVHNRREEVHELFSYNLYPGPSAKKGVYGLLLHQGEQEGWVTAHCATVKVITPYDNHMVFMHEGASGGGKSEMLEYPQRESDGRLLGGQNLVTGEKRYLILPYGCKLRPVTDDMALCHQTIRGQERKLDLFDAEDAWFVRVNHIRQYGDSSHLEKLTVNPPEPLLFLNIDAAPNGRALIWDHIEDAPGKPCPNPRVVIPRRIVPGIVEGDVTVDIRSFGVRTPPCTREKPTYGILGLFHILPPALAWLWRLTSPRGHDNPSVVQKGEGITSEGVGSFWPFATGRRVEFANLLLRQLLGTPDTIYALIPNQHIGAWRVDFMPQWICREYLARRGGSRFREDQLTPARCPLLGYSLASMTIEGSAIGHEFLQVETQPEVGAEAYDQGAALLMDFFREQLALYQKPELLPLGHEIIESCLAGAGVKELDALSRRPL